MREALNSNPLIQAAVLGVLLVGGAIFMLAPKGGSEEEAAPAETSVSATESAGGGAEATVGSLESAAPSASGASAASVLAATNAPPLPRPVVDAYTANRTIVLLVVHNGGIDDRLVKTATQALAGFRRASVFVVPADRISRYAAITEGAGVERVPALVVVTPRHLDPSVPTASVSYGFQSRESIAQAVIDAGYEGPTLEYHP